MNHPLRSFWRALAFLSGVYVLVFGVVGFVQSSGLETFAQPGQHELPVALGLYANPAFSLLSIVVGAVVVLGTLIGRNIDRVINFGVGSVFTLVSMFGLLVLRNDLNYLGFSMATCIVSAVLGLVMLTSGLYGKVGAADAEPHGAHA